MPDYSVTVWERAWLYTEYVVRNASPEDMERLRKDPATMLGILDVSFYDSETHETEEFTVDTITEIKEI